MTKCLSYPHETKNKRTGQYLLVHIVVLLTYIGLTLPYTIFPHLFVGDNSSSSRMILYSLLVSIYPLGQMIGMIIFGDLSDSYGRKNILLMTLAGAIITFILSGITLASHSYYLLIFIRFFCGMFEGNYTIALAIINDLSSQTGNKKKWYGRMNIAVTVGFILGPFLGTIFSDTRKVSWFDDSTPFYVAAIISVVTFIAVKFYFKETLRNRIKTEYSRSLAKYLQNYVRKIRQCFQNNVLSRLILINLFITVAVDIIHIFMPVYMVHSWN
jgi:DHA1 family tetracycline resistance protein-like MFS transporter